MSRCFLANISNGFQQHYFLLFDMLVVCSCVNHILQTKDFCPKCLILYQSVLHPLIPLHFKRQPHKMVKHTETIVKHIQTMVKHTQTNWSNTLKQFVWKNQRIIWVCWTILWRWRLKGKGQMVLKNWNFFVGAPIKMRQKFESQFMCN